MVFVLICPAQSILDECLALNLKWLLKSKQVSCNRLVSIHLDRSSLEALLLSNFVSVLQSLNGAGKGSSLLAGSSHKASNLSARLKVVNH